MIHFYKSYLVVLICFVSISSVAAEFKSLKYNINMNLKCTDIKDGAYCISKKKDIILNVTVQKRSPKDSLINFKKHLEQKIVRAYEYVSKVKKTEKVFLNDWAWISSQHYGSEYLNYNTQYYTTVKGNSSYLISISYKDGAIGDKEILDFSKSLEL